MQTSTEQRIVAELKAEYARLSGEAQADFAKSISWSERHFWWFVPSALILGILIGHFG